MRPERSVGCPPDLLHAPNISESQLGEVRLRFEILSADVATGRFKAKVTYRIVSESWEQVFEAQVLTDESFDMLVNSVNLRLDRWLDDRRTWAVLKARSSGQDLTGSNTG